jgi:dTDP-glucose 4,6-dehydratase
MPSPHPALKLPSPADLDAMSGQLAGVWEQLRGKRIFLTGGTGFVGKWLLAALVDADRRLGLGVRATVLTRNADAFRQAAPVFAGASCTTLLQGDVRDFAPPDAGFDLVIHAATDVVGESSPIDVFDACVGGTRRVLDLAVRAGATRFLLVSSGAVYGRQPPQLPAVPESFTGGPDPLAPGSVYGEGKRAAESLCAIYARQHGLQACVARCFAFVGPYLPLDKHFAIGNFIQAAMAGTPIQIKGDGTPLRTYLYAADLSVWLWTLLLRGRAGAAYNVGGDEAISIAELAARTAALLSPGLPVQVAQQAPAGRPAERYVPDITLAREELGLQALVPLDEAILKTADWHRPAAQASR